MYLLLWQLQFLNKVKTLKHCYIFTHHNKVIVGLEVKNAIQKD